MNYRQLQEQARRLFELGMQQMRSVAYKDAVHNLKQALTIYRKIKDRKGEGYTLWGLGVAYFSAVEYDQAIDYSNQSLVIAREINDQQLEKMAQLALDSFQKDNNPQQKEAQRLCNQAFQQINIGQLEAAEQSLKQALSIYRELQYYEQEARVLGNLGAVCNYLGKFSEAIKYLQGLLEFFSQQPTLLAKLTKEECSRIRFANKAHH